MSTLKISHKSYSSLNMSSLESHDFYEIYFLLDGKRSTFIEQKTFEIEKNCILIVPPFTLHKTMSHTPCDRINIYISNDLVSKHNLNFLTYFGKTCFYLDDQSLQSVRSFLLSATLQKDLLDVEDLKAIANSIIFFVSSQKNLISEAILNENIQLNNAVTYIHENYKNIITINSLCKDIFISKTKLYGLFNKFFHSSINDYILNVRLNKAKQLITLTSLSMEKIAEMCGFSSANYLMFKRKIGLSPCNYRKSFLVDY